MSGHKKSAFCGTKIARNLFLKATEPAFALAVQQVPIRNDSVCVSLLSLRGFAVEFETIAGQATVKFKLWFRIQQYVRYWSYCCPREKMHLSF